MAQRKGNLHVKDRSSEEKDEEDLDIVTAASWSVFPQPQGRGKAPTGAGQYPFQKLPVGVGPEGQPAGYYWTHTLFSTLDLLNWKSSTPFLKKIFKKNFVVVVQLELSAFSPHLSTPPQPNPPPSPASTLSLCFVHVSFIVVPENPSPHYLLPTPLWLLLDCS